MNRSPTSSARRAPHPLALAAICLGYFMTILDTTVVNVALPSVQREFHVGVTGLQWVVDGYALVFAAVLLTGGALGDRLGNRRVFLAGLLAFAAASAGCAVAPTFWALQASRALQGLGAALLVPTSLALLRQAHADPAGRARAIGIWGGVAGVAAASGPVLGGVLTDALGWRSVFLVNVPVAFLAAGLTLRFVARSRPQPERGLDLPAQLAGVVALGLLTFGLIEAQPRGWTSAAVVGALAVAALAAAGFVAVERRTAQPMLALDLFRRPGFSAGNAVGLLINLGFYGQLFLLSLFFQRVRGDSALLTGLALLPETGVVMISSTLSGRVAARVGPRRPMLAGLVVGGAGLLAMTRLGAQTPYGVVAPMLAAAGFGMAFTMPAMTAAVLESAPGVQAGIASAVLNAARQVGGVLGVALLGGLVAGGEFVAGMHVALAVAGAAFLAGAVVTVLGLRPGRPAEDAEIEDSLAGDDPLLVAVGAPPIERDEFWPRWPTE